jgi:hypothetical protein
MAKKNKVATIQFLEDSSGMLEEVLKLMLGRWFDYKDQDGTHLCVLRGIGTAPGLVYLQDISKRTHKPVRNPYMVDLYTDGTLTYL